jgi:polysaccharide biosynthesis/export protein
VIVRTSENWHMQLSLSLALLMTLAAVPLGSQPKPVPGAGSSQPAQQPGATLPSDYVIGVDDVLSVVFWKEKDLSAEVVVRPDGKISLPMLNDVPAVGMTPEQLAKTIEQAALKYVREPGATVMVKAIHSRKVYIVGEVGRPGTVPLANGMTVLQAIAEAGGLLEHAKKNDVAIVRMVSGREQRFRFNYNDVLRGRNTQQNITLHPGDTILVR